MLGLRGRLNRPRGAAFLQLRERRVPPRAVRPAFAERGLTRPFVPASTDLERALAALWQEALRLDRVGVEDDFFDLGGDSLIAVHLLGRIGRRLGMAAPPAAPLLYQARTVRQLAATMAAVTSR
ncbi:MAG: hypothetical protein GEU94_11945 [Micromonosporaceae bacterium]|nr:hypothetical protein [Micromonosporaceae bacterium]